MKNIWNKLTNWFEYGDLVPLIVIVSAAHYIAILKDNDPLYSAIAIGILVDLGHYRTVRAAVRYQSKFLFRGFWRWLIAAGMTTISLNYHQRYYNDYWLSVPLPLLIAALAWLHKVDANVGKSQSKTQSEVSKTKSKTSKQCEFPDFQPFFE